MMARRPREALRFTRVKLTNWRNFREAEMRLTQRAFRLARTLRVSPNFLPAARQSEEMFSDGTLRLIGFLWAIAEGGGPLLLEEPELSLHETVVAQLPVVVATAQRNSGRQVIATTHSALLVDASGVGLHEVHALKVGQNGTKIETGANVEEIKTLVGQNWSIFEATLPRTKLPAEVHYAGEGLTDVAVARRLIIAAGGLLGIEHWIDCKK